MTFPVKYPAWPIHVERGLQVVEDSAWAWVRIPTVTHQWRHPAATLQVVQQMANLIARQRCQGVGGGSVRVAASSRAVERRHLRTLQAVGVSGIAGVRATLH